MKSDKSTGKAAGGHARASKLTPEQRSESARRAARAKAAKSKLPIATHGSTDHPLRLGEIEIPCYVLEDGTRVLSLSGLIGALGISYGSTRSGDRRVVQFVESSAIRPFAKSEIVEALRTPIEFIPPHGGRSAYGYPATLLADICEAVLAARANGPLSSSQEAIAKQCEVLVRGFARVGIIALVDEVTGYQRDRTKDELAKILEAFVAKELQPYVKTFPPEYYEELFRLRGLKYPPENPRFRPQYFGVLTNDIVYARVAPGLLEELKRRAAKDEKKAHLHRRLTQEIGHPKLREHLASVVTAMKLSDDYSDFVSKLNRLHPRFGDTIDLDLEDKDVGQ
ncbi:P63C domain-containing protein [Castellaniella ginsengisoli]|uniref:P63C domain-containing protein n=1 Tax=Castellaniella ginsengisoli TaxID=546114 RepID=A0AB39CU18_9BURK